jgi:hypothetical protein
MQEHRLPGSVFSDQGVAFDDILQGDRLGGIGALRTYIELRRAQLLRELSSVPAGSDFYKRCIDANEAFLKAEALLPNLKGAASVGSAAHRNSDLRGLRP